MTDRNTEHRAKYRVAHPDRVRTSNAKWYAANRDKAIARAAAWQIAHPVRTKQLHGKYYDQDRKKYIARATAWSKRNPSKRTAIHARRRASQLCATPRWANKFFIEEAYDLARLRTQVMGFKWHVDHIVPLRSRLVCGLHVEHNLQVIPATENMSKHNRRWPDMPTQPYQPSI